MRVRVNEPEVVYEAFDEEVVIVNLDTGNYYSVRGSGPGLWMMLSKGVDPDEIAEAIASTQGGSIALLRSQVGDFVHALLQAELVVETMAAPAARASWTGPFTPPALETYTDMQELLMLDPIHDVDAGGWPLAKEA